MGMVAYHPCGSWRPDMVRWLAHQLRYRVDSMSNQKPDYQACRAKACPWLVVDEYKGTLSCFAPSIDKACMMPETPATPPAGFQTESSEGD